MALSITGEQVELVLRKLLPREGYRILNTRCKNGETGADIIAQKKKQRISIECIGFQDHPPTRSKQFYEVFFRAISRLKNEAHHCIMALPMRFKRGMNTRAKQYGEAWSRIGEAFPELEIWLVDVQKKIYEKHRWDDWPVPD
jgi:Holliday junction resolvase-like predicted endonuclease